MRSAVAAAGRSLGHPPSWTVVPVGMLLTLAGTRAVVSDSYLLPSAVALAVAGGGVLRRPDLATKLVVVLAMTFLPQRILPLDLGGVRTDLVEVLALLLVALAVLTAPRSRLPHAGPLWCVFASFCVGGVIAAHNGATFGDVLGPLKTAALYLFPFVLGACFPSSAQRQRFATWVIRVATGATILVLLTAAAGVTYGAGDSTTVYTLGAAAQAQRLRPALLSLVVVATLLLVSRMAVSGIRPFQTGQLALFLLLVLLSYNRSTLAPLLAAAVAVALLHTGGRRATRLTRNLLLSGTAVLLLGLGASAGALGTSGQAVLDRVASIGNPKAFDDPTYLDRESENESAVRTLRERPVFGVGLEQPYGAARTVYYPTPPRLVTVQRTFIHNSFYGVWLQTGLLGLAAVAWLLVRVLRDAGVGRRLSEPDEAGLRVAGAAGVVALLASGLFQPVLYHRPTILALGLCVYFAWDSGDAT